MTTFIYSTHRLDAIYFKENIMNNLNHISDETPKNIYMIITKRVIYALRILFYLAYNKFTNSTVLFNRIPSLFKIFEIENHDKITYLK